MRTIAALLIGVLAVGCGDAPVTPAPDSERSLRQGDIVGTSSEDGSVHVWRGIAFARPPIDELRWRAPLPPEPWDGSFEALTSGSSCPQPGGDPLLGSENCLYLDVYAPAISRAELPTGSDRLPVMFWIHGGGNSMGAGDQLDPSRLVADDDVIVVTINYRLGVFGWFSHPALRERASSVDDASGNFGTLDMIRALEWVRDEIASFGGDPSRVTIFGESAGGLNVFSLLLSPRASGLFHAAIAQSGAPASMTRVQAEALTDAPDPGLGGSSSEVVLALLEQAGRATDREAAKLVAADMTPAETEAFLREHDTDEILAPFFEAIGNRTLPIYISPTILRDGVVIPDADPLERFATPGAYNEVPVIAGSNREESKLFFALTSPHVSRTFGIPTGFTDLRRYDLEGEYGGLTWRAMGVDEPISALHRAQGDSVYAYRFDWDEQPSVLGFDVSKLLGAAHGLELPFVFGLTDLGFANRFLFEDPETAEELSRRMRSYWTHFAHTLVPERGRRGDLPHWPAWNPTPGTPKYLVFDSTKDGGIETGTDVFTKANLVELAIADPRLQTDAERCDIFKNMVQWSDALTPEQYTEVNDGACRDHPIDGRLYFATLPE